MLPSKKLLKYVCGLCPHFQGSVTWLSAFNRLTRFINLCPQALGSRFLSPSPSTQRQQPGGYAENKIRYSNMSMCSPTSWCRFQGQPSFVSKTIYDRGFIQASPCPYLCVIVCFELFDGWGEISGRVAPACCTIFFFFHGGPQAAVPSNRQTIHRFNSES